METKPDWLERIKLFEKNLSRAERDLLRYVNVNPEKVLIYTQKEFAAAANVSKPIVISFFKKLGYSSHREFQHSIEDFFSTHIDSYRASQNVKNKFDNIEDLIKEAFEVDIRAMERLSVAVSPDSVTRTVGEILNRRTIWITGPGTAYYPAHYLYQRLRRYQISSMFVTQDPTHRIDELYPASGNDMMIIFHYTEEDKWLSPILDFAGKRNIFRVLVSAIIHPRYINESDVFFHVPRGELNFKNSMALPMAFSNMLLLALENAGGEEIQKKLKGLEIARSEWNEFLRD